ncbi:MAG: hypothetical protein M4D80_06755 [Myxococcota bacterium]|nr:hypothetical protein [Myxococcota bacterium]
MRRLLVILACLSASSARADGFYFTESFGGSDVKSDLAAYIPSAVHVRVGVGLRSGAWALETFFGAHIGNEEGTAPDDRPGWDRYNALTTYGLDLKYIQPMSKHLEAYLRGGLRYGSMDDGSPIDSYGGRGLGGGAGIQLKGKVRALGLLCFPLFFLSYGPKITGALWIDASYSFYRLHPGGRQDATPAIDAKITTLSGGFALGSDF